MSYKLSILELVEFVNIHEHVLEILLTLINKRFNIHKVADILARLLNKKESKYLILVQRRFSWLTLATRIQVYTSRVSLHVSGTGERISTLVPTGEPRSCAKGKCNFADKTRVKRRVKWEGRGNRDTERKEGVVSLWSAISELIVRCFTIIEALQPLRYT